MTADAREIEFIRANTRLTEPSLVPELRLWLADELTPLWHATEAWLAERNCAPPYWAFAWAGGQALARYLLDTPSVVQGRIFDLASGGGVSAIAAATLGAQVTANEIDPLALAAIRLNAAANGVTLALAAGDHSGQQMNNYDTILAGDICYDRAMTDRLLPWLRDLARAGRTVLLADPGRAYLPQMGLQPLASYTVPVTQDLESAAVRHTAVYKLIA